MLNIDLITGFLGSGKTTFIRKYASILMERGMHLGILENDFGAVNVDMMLLQDLTGENCELEMVSGGCDYDCHQRRFKTKLIAMKMAGYDRVLVEPSGIYDVDEFFDTLNEDPLSAWYAVGNVIAIVDARLEEGLSEQADYMLMAQIANAGLIVMSHVQEASKEEIERTIAHINRALEHFRCRRRITMADVLAKDWDSLDEEDIARILACGSRREDHIKVRLEDGSDFQSLFFMHVHMSPEELRERTARLFADPAAGEIFRIKGFLQDKDGWIELNATKERITMQPIAEGQEILIVIGEHLDKEAVAAYWPGATWL